MPIKISKRSKKTKGKGKVSQSQQVVVNINKGKRKASSQPVMRQSQPPIIIQQPQQDYSALENLFRQYSSSRSVAEPKPVTMGMETQPEKPISVTSETQTPVGVPPNLEEIRRLQKILAEDEENFFNISTPRDATPPRRSLNQPAVRVINRTSDKTNVEKVLNPDTNRPVTIGGDVYKKLVKKGKINANSTPKK